VLATILAEQGPASLAVIVVGVGVLIIAIRAAWTYRVRRLALQQGVDAWIARLQALDITATDPAARLAERMTVLEGVAGEVALNLTQLGQSARRVSREIAEIGGPIMALAEANRQVGDSLENLCRTLISMTLLLAPVKTGQGGV
jgi:hypothetical protein